MVSPSPQARIFVCYRREDASGHVNGLVDRLEKEFGKDDVFADVRSWRAGDFRKTIDAVINSCKVLLVVVGRDWLTLKDADGNVRLAQPDDYVRLEIASGLRRGIPIIPVLVGGASMPTGKNLPDEIKDFAFQNAIELRDSSWPADLDQFVEKLRALLGVAPPYAPRPTQWKWYAVALTATILLGSGAYYKFIEGDGTIQRLADAPLSTASPTPGNAVVNPKGPLTNDPASGANLVGTTWRGRTQFVSTDDHADYRFRFVDRYNVEWVVIPHGRGRKSLPTRRCSYEVSGNKVTITHSTGNINRSGTGGATITLSGDVEGDTITGKGNNTAGVSWTWKVTKVSALTETKKGS